MTLLTLALVLASGPTVGGRAGPYSFLVATGPERGQPTCYVCGQEDKPTAVVFARTLSDSTGKLMAKLDADAGTRTDGFKAWLTHLTETADLDGLATWSRKHNLQRSPVGAFEGVDGPPAYKLTREADMTVVLFVNRKVTATFAFKAGELTEAKVREVTGAAGKR